MYYSECVSFGEFIDQQTTSRPQARPQSRPQAANNPKKSNIQLPGNGLDNDVIVNSKIQSLTEKVDEMSAIIESYKSAFTEVNNHVNELRQQCDYQQQVIEEQQTTIEDLAANLFNHIENQPKAEAMAKTNSSTQATLSPWSLIFLMVYFTLLIIILRFI